MCARVFIQYWAGVWHPPREIVILPSTCIPRVCKPWFPNRGSRLPAERRLNQERTRHINLRKSPGTPAGCPWDTRRDKQGSTGRCPRNFLLFTIEELPFLPGHRPGVPGTPGRPGDFQKIYVIFSYVPFLLPIKLR